VYVMLAIQVGEFIDRSGVDCNVNALGVQLANRFGLCVSTCLFIVCLRNIYRVLANYWNTNNTSVHSHNHSDATASFHNRNHHHGTHVASNGIASHYRAASHSRFAMLTVASSQYIRLIH
jgi:hypothetical protein